VRRPSAYPGSRLSATALLSVLLLGAIVGAVDLPRPVDGRSRELWRETDVSGIARNFTREGMNILYPRIDWRGDGPGYVEMEFPAYPYLIAVGYKVFGIHEQIGRVISYAAALITLFLFLRLAAFVLPPPAALAAGVFYALNPIVARLADAIQPEPFMLLGYVGAMYAWTRWLDDERWWWYAWALAFTAFAVLAKAPAAHIGIAFLLLAIWRRGWGVFRQGRVWAFAVVALAPAAIWYVHAHGFWTTYGNSLGVSNHHHFAGLSTFVHPRYIAGIARIELSYVWGQAGLLAVLLALTVATVTPGFWYGLLWYVAVGVYYLVIAGTSADQWAIYYHIVSVPPAALLVGWAASVLWERLRGLDARSRARAAVMTAGLLVAMAGAWFAADLGRAILAALAAAGVIVITIVRLRAPDASLLARSPIVIAGLASVTLATFAADAGKAVKEERHARWLGEFATAQMFGRLMTPGARIVVSGNLCVTPTESAYQQPWYLYWTDHKGFSPCIQDHSLALVQDLVGRGAQYFVVDEPARRRRPDFVAEMRRQYPVLAETPQATLFHLTPIIQFSQKHP
jgi:hypothetical protein